MSARRRELELLLLAIFAALPLYATQTIRIAPLIVFHAAMIAMAVRVAAGRSAQIVPPGVMRGLAIAYIFFYVIDVAALSRNAIAASTHLVLFITVYQPIESQRTKNHAQRILTASLIFLASLATATHISILPVVVVFAFMLFRQLMHASHTDSVDLAHAPAPEPPSSRAATFYVAGAGAIGILLFPILPRVRNPIVPGIAGSLGSASTGLSDSIDFNQAREIKPDATVVSRVWMGQEAIPFFTPLRLRGAVYERFAGNKWLQARREFAPLGVSNGVTRVAVPSGFSRPATVQQRFIVGTRLFLPVGTYEVIGVPQVIEGPTRDVYMAWQTRRDLISYDVRLARSTSPLRVRRVPPANYPVSPPVAAMARQIAGNTTDPMVQAAAIEHYLSTRFRYIPNPADIGHAMTVDNFLLKERRGHCEYFAAGMVALLTSLQVPARIVGGFYGGKLNPLTGYFVVRREDAHAWVEVYDGGAWRTFDPTPASLRPGNTQTGLIPAYASALSDSVNYFWDRYILTFGLGDQIALAAEAIGRARGLLQALQRGSDRSVRELLNIRFASVLLTLIAGGLTLIWIVRMRHSLFDQLAGHLRQFGIEVGPAVTMEEALDELQRRHPEAAASLDPLIRLYDEERFSATRDRRREAAIRKRLAELRV